MSARILGIIGVALLPLCAMPASAQDADSVELGRVVAHIDAARFDSARVALARWQAARAADARPAERAAGDALAARLETDGGAARDAWLGLALAHPFSANAGLALLRVGQAAVLLGDTTTALVYLTRLVDDFPGSGHGAEAQLWISRAHSLARHSARACAAARAGLAAAASAEVGGLLRIQEQRACAPGAPEAPSVASAGTPAPEGHYAVQSGAFRARAGADALVERLRDAGLEPRLVRVPGSELMRVRVGSFDAQAAAIALRDQLRSDGFDAVVVDDVGRETAVP